MALTALRVVVRVYECDEDRRRRLLEPQPRLGEKFAGRQRPSQVEDPQDTERRRLLVEQ